jgi:peptidoglycan/xylan/chitin deacetylase (PgdA/CDA1 family)
MLTSLARRLLGRTSEARIADAVILMYHRVDIVERDPWRLAVAPSLFAEHLEVICDRFLPISMQRLCAGLAGGDMPRRSVVITFDDGYRDNVTNAKPLLEKHGVPASMFVTTGYLDSERDFWWEELVDICGRRGLDARIEWERLQPLGRTEREVELDQLWRSAGIGAPPAPSHTLTSGDVSELAAEGLFEIGAHTVTHPSLSRLPPADQLEEIRSSKAVLETLVGRPVSSFSYPHGDFSRATVQALRAQHFGSACTTSGEPLTRRSRPLELPRVHVLDWTGAELEEQLDRRLQRP